MEALMATYGDTSSTDSEDKSPRSSSSRQNSNNQEPDRLPPPPLDLFGPPNPLDYLQMGQGSRVRSFPHIEGNYALHVFIPDDEKLRQVALGKEFHISLGRTVPIRVHQVDSVLAMLRQKLQSQKRYWIDFSKWEVFVNDEQTRSFLSMEVTAGGLAEIIRQINAVNEIYRFHNLPEFYKDPRPPISHWHGLLVISVIYSREGLRNN